MGEATMTPNRITRLIAWAKRLDGVFVVTVILVAGFVVALSWLFHDPKPAKPKPTASIPAIPKVDFNAADRAMIQRIYSWTVDQDKAKWEFERDMKAGRIPRLPGVE